MPNHTVSGNVDTMMRAANNAAIRSAIGVGQTDAPTFGTSLSLVNGAFTATIASAFGNATFSGEVRAPTGDFSGLRVGQYSTGSGVYLERDAPGILAQRNGDAAQAFRLYNSTDATPATNYDRASFGFASNVLRIGTENGGTYTTTRPIAFIVGGASLWGISVVGVFGPTTDNAYDIGAIGANRPRHVNVAGSIRAQYSGLTTAAGVTMAYFQAQALGVVSLTDNSGYDFVRLQIGGPLDTYPAIARDGAGIKFTGAAAGSTSWIKVPAVAVASLPLAATAGVGARSFVNDALSPVFGSAVTGGGAVTVPVYSTGSAWNVG